VYEHVKRRILDDDLRGGALISESEIATALDVSRTPVREAFRRLQSEGYLQVLPQRGALITPIAPGEISDVLEARLLIETRAAAHVAARPPRDRAALLARLEAVLDEQDDAHRAGDLARYSALDADFHLGVIEASGNALLTSFARSLRERQQRLVAHGVHGDTDRGTGFLAGHRRLLDRLHGGDAAGYAEELAGHLAAVEEALA